MQVPESILIVKLSAIGDVVHSLPLLEVLRANFPHAKIDWLVEEDSSQVIEGHPAIDRTIVSCRKSWQRRLLKGGHFSSVLSEVVVFVKQLRSRRYDLVIDVQGLLKSGILTGLSRGKRKIGMSGAREGARFFVNEKSIRVSYNEHAIDRYLRIAEYLECDLTPWKGDIPILESDKLLIDRVLDTNGPVRRPLVAINPVAKWKTKLWEQERFAILADRLRDDLSCDIVFTGSKEDRAVIRDISGRMNKRPLNLAGQTHLKDLAYLYSRCNALVTTDTGPMHIAAAMGCPVVALFGPTSPLRTGPYGEGHKVIRADVDCSPCFKKTCDHMTCMKEIKVDGVFDAVKDLITV